MLFKYKHLGTQHPPLPLCQIPDLTMENSQIPRGIAKREIGELEGKMGRKRENSEREGKEMRGKLISKFIHHVELGTDQ